MKKLFENITFRQLCAKAHKQTKPIVFSDQLKKSKRILVCMPASPSEFAGMVKSINQFRLCFPQAHITLLQPQTIPVPANLTLGFQVVVWAQPDVDRMGKPGKELKKRLFNEPFDLVVDLNITPHFFAMAVAVESNAPIRAGFSDSARSQIYNLVIRPETADTGQYMAILLSYLGTADPRRTNRR